MPHGLVWHPLNFEDRLRTRPKIRPRQSTYVASKPLLSVKTGEGKPVVLWPHWPIAGASYNGPSILSHVLRPASRQILNVKPDATDSVISTPLPQIILRFRPCGSYEHVKPCRDCIAAIQDPGQPTIPEHDPLTLVARPAQRIPKPLRTRSTH